MRFLAFYLPQFHPIPENDRWWGPGFTEWANVARARPRFRGHRQPQLPTITGFYDLRLPETRALQAELARAHGIHGFVYYHTWFQGRRLLERPLDEVMETGRPDFPFALCWANESWTRAWDGRERDVLVAQEYSIDDHREHADFLVRCFADDRYIRIGGRPLFLIYRPARVAELDFLVASLRERCRDAGFDDVYLVGVRSAFGGEFSEELMRRHFQGVVDFQPNPDDYPDPAGAFTRLVTALKEHMPDALYQYLKTKGRGKKVVDYRRLVAKKTTGPLAYHDRVFPCAFPSWDNSPRRATATIIQNDDPELFASWLRACREHAAGYPPEEQLVFVNAWNEWAEGCHLEPDDRMGSAFLDAVSRAAS